MGKRLIWHTILCSSFVQKLICFNILIYSKKICAFHFNQVWGYVDSLTEWCLKEAFGSTLLWEMHRVFHSNEHKMTKQCSSQVDKVHAGRNSNSLSVIRNWLWNAVIRLKFCIFRLTKNSLPTAIQKFIEHIIPESNPSKCTADWNCLPICKMHYLS